MYTNFSQVYEEKIKEDIDYEDYHMFIANLLKKYLPGTDALLDIGAGTGLASYALRSEFKTLTLAEPSAEMLALARERFEPPFKPVFLNIGADTVVRANGFNVIIAAYDVLNYLEPSAIQSFFENAYRQLRENGLLIFDHSTTHKLKTVFGSNIYVYDDEDYFHVWENTEEAAGINITINAFKKTGKFYDRITEEQFMRFVHQADLMDSARTAGFNLLEIKDDYSEAEFNTTSFRAVYVMRKEIRNG